MSVLSLQALVQAYALEMHVRDKNSYDFLLNDKRIIFLKKLGNDKR